MISGSNVFFSDAYYRFSSQTWTPWSGWQGAVNHDVAVYRFTAAGTGDVFGNDGSLGLVEAYPWLLR
jgi:hypothetical protein